MTKSLRTASLTVLTVVASIIAVTPSTAADDVIMLNVSDAMASAHADGRLDGTVRFYFGNSTHPAVLHNFGEYVANEKTNAFGKSKVNACNWVFESALLRLQSRALSLGANAVVDIHSYYKAEDELIDTQAPCHAGFLMAGVALRGKVVKIS